MSYLDKRTFIVTWKVKFKVRILRFLRFPYRKMMIWGKLVPQHAPSALLLHDWLQLAQHGALCRWMDALACTSKLRSLASCSVASWLHGEGHTWRGARAGPLKQGAEGRGPTYLGLRAALSPGQVGTMVTRRETVSS